MAARYAAAASDQNSSRSGYAAREIPARPPRKCSIDGDGMVNFAVLSVSFLRKAKSSTMIGREYFSFPVTVGIGGCSSVPPNFGPGFSRSVTPSSRDRKSRCHQWRRNSPSVTPSRPIASCLFTTARIARSWISRSRLFFSSSGGRKRLPTWSARNGGFMNARMLPSHAPVNILFASETEKAEHWIPLLERALPQDRILLRPEAPIDVALVATPPPGTLENLKDVKLIQSLWMGVEKLLADPALPKGVPLARLVDPGMVAAMSETVLAHVLDWHRHHYAYRAQQQGRRWHRHRQYLASDRTVGILGLGELGSDAARKLLALGFNVAGYSRRPKELAGVRSFTELAPMLRITDALVCLLPLTPETRNILNGRNLSLLRKHGCVINLARGGHLVVSDLLRENDPLWRHPGVTITPHSAALTEPRTAIPKIVENVERVRRGETPQYLVDFAAGY